ncbi:MAG: glycerol-3-phosphate acyltransferase [Candidatus Dormibacteraeota bacterium]|nr:glycerol-3-phosphate acyltransferase [Candidatus Dormibacteraeota bacterium]
MRHGLRLMGAGSPPVREDGAAMGSGLSNSIGAVLAACAGGYLVGGLPIGWLFVRWRRYGLDVRRYGSGNIGTSNVYRHAGFDVAVFVGPLQFAQGFVPVLVTRLIGFSTEVQVLVAICCVLGNGWPVYLRFNGGRGVAVATGAVAPLSIAGFVGLLVCYAAGAIRGHIAEAVAAAFVILPVVAFLFNGVVVCLGAVGILALLLARRLEGLPDDARAYGHIWKLTYERLVHDERPGRPLMGPRTDPGAQGVRKG